MQIRNYTIRNAQSSEYEDLGALMVRVYSQIESFPSPEEQPKYYKMLSNIGHLTQQAGTELIVAVDEDGQLGGGVVYFDDMAQYGSGGSATEEKNAAGFRLLAIDASHRRQGLGKLLSQACIEKARLSGRSQVIIHSTQSMQVAWKMYEKLGFERSFDLDFMQEKLPVFGFRLSL